MKKSDPIAALEIGTTFTTLTVAERVDQNLKIVARVTLPSNGVRKSRITDIAQTTHVITQLRERVRKDFGYDITTAYLAMTGPHIHARTLSAQRPLRTETVTVNDIDEIYNDAIADERKSQEKTIVLDAFELGYDLDGLSNIRDPRGLTGRTLTLHNLHILGDKESNQDAVNAAAGAGITIEEASFATMCSARAVLSEERRKAGTLAIDLGGGTTGATVYLDGHCVYALTLGLGGDHVTNDIRHAFQVTRQQGEELKCREAQAIPSDTRKGRIELAPSMPGLMPTVIPQHALDIVVNARMREIFTILFTEIEKAGCLHCLQGGIVLMGGGAALPGCAALAESVFGLKTICGKLLPEIIPLENDAQPMQMASTAGLILHFIDHDMIKVTSEGFTEFMKGIFRK